MRVLVVDDSSQMRFLLRVFLEDAGIEVEEAASGQEALERLARPGPAVAAAVLDQRMPDLTGLEVARELVARGKQPRLFLFTAYLQPALEAEAHALGVTPLLKTHFTQLVDILRGPESLAA